MISRVQLLRKTAKHEGHGEVPTLKEHRFARAHIGSDAAKNHGELIKTLVLLGRPEVVAHKLAKYLPFD